MNKQVMMINTIDNRGGAAQIAWNIRKGMIDRGWRVPMYVGTKYSSDTNVHVIPRFLGQISLERMFGNDLVFARTDYLLKTADFKNADLIHCHNLHTSFFNLTTLLKMSQQKLILWTFHDLWPITGGAAGSNEVNHNLHHFLGLWPTDDRLLKQKAEIYRSLQAHIVVPSHWMDSKVHNSALCHLPRTIIPNGIDTDIFTAKDKMAVRSRLGWPKDKKICLFVAKNGLKNRYKGGPYIRRLILETNERVFWVVVGQEQNDSTNALMVPYTNNPRVMADYYRAADVLVYPTLADSFGLVVAESLACGTPVIAFKTDAIPELIIDGKNGLLVNQSYPALKHALITFLKLPKQTLRGKKRTYTTLSEMIDAYEKLYEEMILTNW